MKRRKRMDLGLWLLLGLTIAAAVVAYARDPKLPMVGLTTTARMLRAVGIELALGFLLAGLLDALIPGPALVRWLGEENANRGILVGWVVGLLIPGGPYVFFPIIANLFAKGAAAGPLIALITAKTLVSPIRMLTYEAPLVGWPLTLARFVPGVLLPPVMGVLGQWLFRLFGGRGAPGP
jgi:uncharacterized membrane protein YraQ (UPF0718 family)